MSLVVIFCILSTCAYIYCSGSESVQLGNHLGNVLVTISDRKKGVADPLNAALIKFFEPVMLSGTDYYPFGMAMRIGGDSSYRYGFNGQEKSNEIKGEGNSYTAEFWEYDPRIGRRWNVDPRPMFGVSEYSAFNSNPILHVDIKGDSAEPPKPAWAQKGPIDLAKFKKGGIPVEGNIFNQAGAVVSNWLFAPISNLLIDVIDGIGNPATTIYNVGQGISNGATSLGEWSRNHPDLVGGVMSGLGSAYNYGKENYNNPDFHVQVATDFWAMFFGTMASRINVTQNFTLRAGGSGVSGEMTTLYRGVNSESPAFSLAENGIIKSRGGLFGHTNPLMHNTGLNGTVKSNFTSWTTDIDVALNYAFRQNGEGVLLTLKVPKSSTVYSPSLKQVNLLHKPGTIVNESEVLLKGTQSKIQTRRVSISNFGN